MGKRAYRCCTRRESRDSATPMAPVHTRCSGIVATRSSLLAALRDATRSEHDATEAALGLLRDSLTLDEYVVILERMCGDDEPLEAVLRRTRHLAAPRHAAAGSSPCFALAPRSRTADRRGPSPASLARGAVDSAPQLARCADLPTIDTLGIAEYLGRVHPEAHGETTAAAAATFQTLRRWWEGAPR